MPLTTTPSGSVDAGTTQPPGHMQNENTPRVADRRRQAIGGRRQARMARGAAVLEPVDERLRVLDAHAEGEGLGLEPHAGDRRACA